MDGFNILDSVLNVFSYLIKLMPKEENCVEDTAYITMVSQ